MDKRERDGKVEMPVAMAIMMAKRDDAIESFSALTPERRCEYLERARRSGSVEELRSVIDDIVRIG